jgi:hypothetical protein
MLKLKSHNLKKYLIRSNRRLSLVGLSLSVGFAVFAGSAAWSQETLPDTKAEAISPATTTDASAVTHPATGGATVGSLPSSNQWLYDRTSAFIYLSYNSLVLKSSALNVGHFTSNLGGSDFKYLSIDSFMRLFNLASPEGPSLFGRFAIWGEISVGLGTRDGDLYDNDLHSALPSETSTLTTFFGKAGLQLVYDRLTWLKPYIGVSSTWYAFRNSSSMSGAVAEGGSSVYAPVAGVHIPITFMGNVSAYGEVQRVNAQGQSGQLFANSTAFDGGFGFSF